MRRCDVLFLSLAIGASCAGPPADPTAESPPASTYANDVHVPGPSVTDRRFERAASDDLPYALQRRALRAEGEVLVLEGDRRFVTTMGTSHGITDANQREIVQAVLAEYPDVFDTIQVYLSFLDEAHAGTAYYQAIANQVAGVGIREFNGRPAWGLPPEGRLSGFSNMNLVDQFGPLEQAGRPKSHYHAVIAQELSHRWLMFLKFKDPTGMDSSALLGRMDAHWSKLVHAYGSVQDGLFWKDNGNGTFQNMGEDLGWAPVDLYAMGIYAREQVPPFFYLVEATFEGTPLNATSRIPFGAQVMARKIDVTVDQVIGAMGPRNPPVGTETPYYRAAFVLLTAPGQPAEEWQPYLAAVQQVQEKFPESWREWTHGAGAICTRTRARCPEPDLGLEGFTVTDGGDDLLAPGERFDLHAKIRNDGLGVAEEVKVTLEAASPGVEVTSSTVTVSAVPEGGVAEVPAAFQLKLDASLACGATVKLRIKMTSKEGPRFSDPIDLVIGTRVLKTDAMEEGPDWHVNPDGDDGATVGQWALGVPEFVSIFGVVTQPGEDHTAGEGKLAFFTGPRKGAMFSSNDVDMGDTVLESPIFAIGDGRDPTLVFYAWHVAKNFAQNGAPVPNADLIVSGSNDGGASWVELARVTEDTRVWTRVEVPLADKLAPSNKTRFRFRVSDTTPSGLVEAGIDDLQIIDVLPQCPARPGRPTADAGVSMPPPRTEESGGCSASGSSGAGGALLLLALLGLARRRR